MSTTAPHVLIVEDDDAIADIVQMCLGLDGYRLDRVSNGEECLEFVARDKPDLIVMDLMMPVMDGYTAVSRLAAEEETRSVRVLILTTKGRMEEAFTMYANIVGYLQKPFDPTVLRTRVRTALKDSPAASE